MKRKVDFTKLKIKRGGEFASSRSYADDYAQLVDAVIEMKQRYDSWFTIKNAVIFERKSNKFLRAPGVARDAESIAVREALDEAETKAFWNVVRATQKTHQFGTYNASVELTKQIFKRSAGNFLGKFGIYLLN